MTLFKKLHFQIIDFVEAFHTQYHTILVTEFLPGEMVMVIVVKGMVNCDGDEDCGEWWMVMVMVLVMVMKGMVNCEWW